MNKAAILAALVALTALGCSKNEPQQAGPADASGTAAPATGAIPPAHEDTADPAWDESASPVLGTMLAIKPDPVDFCSEKLAAVEVSWDLNAAAPKNPQIWVRDSKQSKLWTAFKPLTGRKTTGKWVKPGTQFVAIDSTTRKVINVATVVAKDCAQ